MDTPSLLRAARLDCALSRETEAALWRQCRAGDADARRRLIESQLRWCWRLAGRLARGRCADECFQEACLEVMRVVDGTTFDPGKGRLTTTVRKMVAWRLLAMRKLRRYRQDADSLDPEEDVVREHPGFAIEWQDILDRMPRDLRIVVAGLAEGRTLSDIAEECGYSAEWMRQKKLAARTWLIEHGCFTAPSHCAPLAPSTTRPKPRRAA